MWAVADDLAIGAKHGLLQANRVHIWFVRPVIHDTPPLVVKFIAHRTAGYLKCWMKSLACPVAIFSLQMLVGGFKTEMVPWC